MINSTGEIAGNERRVKLRPGHYPPIVLMICGFLEGGTIVSGASCAATSDRIVKRSVDTGDSGKVSDPCVCENVASIRPTEQTSRCIRPTCTGTVSHL